MIERSSVFYIEPLSRMDGQNSSDMRIPTYGFLYVKLYEDNLKAMSQTGVDNK